MSAVDQTVREQAAPLVADADLDLVEVQIRGEGARRVIRVIVDRKGGVDLERCTSVSRALSARLDASGGLDAGYTLEVTSPGVDAPLADRRAFDRVEGRAVLVHRTGADGGVAQIRGTVRAAEAEAVVLDVDGTQLRVPYVEIIKATQSLPW